MNHPVAVRLATPKDAEEIALESMAEIEHNLRWEWSPQRVLEAIDDPDTNVVVAEEAARVQSMKGAVLSVYEIDPWGSAWVEKWWNVGEENPLSHALALTPHEMEVVANGNSDRPLG